MFKEASKQKLRFETNKGYLSVEDLWDLSLESLNSLAISINKRLKEESEESFISKKTSTNVLLELKLNIMKDIISTKLEQKEAAKARKEKQEKLTQLKELAASKENEALSGKSLDEINAMIASLESEE